MGMLHCETLDVGKSSYKTQVYIDICKVGFTCKHKFIARKTFFSGNISRLLLEFYEFFNTGGVARSIAIPEILVGAAMWRYSPVRFLSTSFCLPDTI